MFGYTVDFTINLSDVIMIVFTFFLIRINWRLLWFTGMLQSHSDQKRKIAAKKENIKIILWDPTIKNWPFDGEHGEIQEIDRIYVGIPDWKRKHKTHWMIKFFRGF